MVTLSELKMLVISNNINTIISYKKWVRNNKLDVPISPNLVYNDWVDWYYLFNKSKKKYLNFIESKLYLKDLGIKSIEQYRIWFKNNDNNLYLEPHRNFKEWISWSDYLNHGYISTKNRIMLEFNKARDIVQKYDIKTLKEWQDWISKNKNIYPDIPTCPDQYYEEWISYNDWLGTDKIYYNGERMVLKWLESNNFEYIQQKKFDGCKNKRLLSFDFYLPNRNTCIEYDGEQHYKKDSKFWREDNYINDSIKNKYCLDNNITLIRISYLDIKNINCILDKILIQ